MADLVQLNEKMEDISKSYCSDFRISLAEPDELDSSLRPKNQVNVVNLEQAEGYLNQDYATDKQKLILVAEDSQICLNVLQNQM